MKKTKWGPDKMLELFFFDNLPVRRHCLKSRPLSYGALSYLFWKMCFIYRLAQQLLVLPLINLCQTLPLYVHASALCPEALLETMATPLWSFFLLELYGQNQHRCCLPEHRGAWFKSLSHMQKTGTICSVSHNHKADKLGRKNNVA